MRIFVTGHKGRLGSLLLEHGCLPLVCDVTKYDEVEMAIQKAEPDVVVHLASVSGVDYCEAHKDEAFTTNFLGTKFVAEATLRQRCEMVLLSSDHVFGGRSGPYAEVRFAKNIFGKYDLPVNFYGETKLAAEALQQAYPHMKIVRTSYLFTKERIENELSSSSNFPTFISRSFMYLPHFVLSLKQYLDRYWEMPELLNISGTEVLSWYEFVLKAVSFIESNKKHILPNKQDVTDHHAPRPKRGGLRIGLSRKLGLPQFSYIDGLDDMIK